VTSACQTYAARRESAATAFGCRDVMRDLPVRWFRAPGRAGSRGEAASRGEATRSSTVRGEADPTLQDEREASALAAVRFTSCGAGTPQHRRNRMRRCPRYGERRSHRGPGGCSRAESARGRELSAYSASAGSAELNSSAIMLLRPRHRGQCGFASQRDRSAMLKPQRGQVKSVVRSLLSRLILAEGAEPRLAFGLDPSGSASPIASTTRTQVSASA